MIVCNMLCIKQSSETSSQTTDYPLILKSSNKTGCYARLHLQGVSKVTRVFYDTMIDEEFAKSHKVDKVPRLFGLQKQGMKGNNYEVMKDNEEKCDVCVKLPILN
ncbi:hypothetical protein DFJ58DRAFT_223061 [Suillus subalutaceus]|uniref:uncharacterized protein n=1 Tax=Suillus subalutaceus TaxID=48586 RepID=UPI001B885032|nr:uncharacterized protein DFJ58DRAFT_223061 [Suillus subalutaceus]KAG1833628.1 hypothetical protein DFJ58DRAFT_223061 [Suillus subalutaceus]